MRRPRSWKEGGLLVSRQKVVHRRPMEVVPKEVATAFDWVHELQLVYICLCLLFHHM